MLKIDKYIFRQPNPPHVLLNEKFFSGKYYYLHIKEENKSVIPIYYINKKSQYVILHSHGNGEDLGDIIYLLEYISYHLNISIVGYDYLGYGFSSFANSKNIFNKNKYPSEEGCYKSIKNVYNYLIDNENYHPDNIILMGQSIGSGPTIDLASQKDIKKVILISPFRSIIKVVIDNWSMNWFLKYFDFFCNYKKINKIKGKILFIHGEKDRLVNIKHSKKMIRKKDYKMFIGDVGHDMIWYKYKNEVITTMSIFVNLAS